jgi:hypothetical protein
MANLGAAHDLRDAIEVLVECDRAPVPGRVGAPGLTLLEHEENRRNQIVDVHGQHHPVAPPGERELPGLGHLGRPQDPLRAARSVDVPWADHDGAALAGDAVRRRLRVDVGVAVGTTGSVFVELAGMVIAVDDDRADVDDAIDSRPLGRVQHVHGPTHVQADELVHRSPLADEGRRMDHEVDALEGRVQDSAVGDVGEDRLGAGGCDPLACRGVDVEAAHLRTCGRQPRRHGVADEAACSRDGRRAALESPGLRHPPRLILAAPWVDVDARRIPRCATPCAVPRSRRSPRRSSCRSSGAARVCPRQ